MSQEEQFEKAKKEVETFLGSIHKEKGFDPDYYESEEFQKLSSDTIEGIFEKYALDLKDHVIIYSMDLNGNGMSVKIEKAGESKEGMDLMLKMAGVDKKKLEEMYQVVSDKVYNMMEELLAESGEEVLDVTTAFAVLSVLEDTIETTKKATGISMNTPDVCCSGVDPESLN